MLYVFLVNTGEMLTLDMALTMESVQQLQEALAEEHQIPHDKQVLLISGGQNLDPQMRVCSYSAGTDTNPIFLFSKGTIESAHPPVTTSMSQSREDNLKLQVEGLKNLPPSYSAVVARTQLALQFHEVAKEKVRLCEGMIHNQHLQQQGWMAVIANLDDITNAFQQRANVFQQNMSEFLIDRPNFVQRLEEFADVCHVLEKTPLLSCLIGGDKSPTDLGPERGAITLMMWISRQDHRSTLQQMSVQCTKVLEQFNQPIFDSLSTEIKTCLEAVSNPGMKEIKGLGERLFGLDQLSLQARKLLNEQAEMAQGLVQNQTRASNIKDPSVLPDLCLSHQQQLTVMYKKHLQLTDMSRRCEVAKEELCQNLHVRLRWVMYVEQQISSVHAKMVVYHENLKRLRKRLEIIRQVCLAPKLYASAVVEVCRRRVYNSQYHAWADHVSQKSVSEHDDEISRRKTFASLMQNHFLNALFPGFYEMPPTFATTPPSDYDNTLPAIVENDIHLLREKVPELAQFLELPLDQHFPADTSRKTKLTSPRPLSCEIETQTELLSHEPTLHPEPAAKALSSIEEQPQGLRDTQGIASEDSHSDSTKTLTEAEGGRESPTRELGLLEREPNQPRLLSLDMLPHGNQAELEGKFESVYRDAPFASLLPEVDSEFHSAIGSPMDETLVRKAKMEQILPALVPMEENQTLKQQLEDRERILEELEEKKNVLEKKLSESENQIGDLRESITCRSQRLEESQHTVESLSEVVQTHVQELRNKCDGIRKSVVESKQQMQTEIEGAILKLTEHSRQVEKDLARARASAVKLAEEQLEREYGAEKAELLTRLKEQEEGVELANRRWRKLEDEVRDRDSNTEMLKSKYHQDLENVKSKYVEEERQMIASLKMELEMEITDLEAVIQERDKEIEHLKIDAAQRFEDLEKRFGEEKAKELCDLRREMEANHKSELCNVEMTLQNTHLEEFADFKKSSRMQTESELDNQRTQLEDEHREEMEGLKKQLEERIEASRREVQESCERKIEEEQQQGKAAMDEREMAVEEHRKEMDTLKTEHEEEKRRLETEMRDRLNEKVVEMQASLVKELEEEKRRFEEELKTRREAEEEEKERVRKELLDQLEVEQRGVADLKSTHDEEFKQLQEVISRLRAEMKQKEEELNAKWAESVTMEKGSAVQAALEEEKEEEEKRMKALRQRLDEEKLEAVRIAVEMAKFEQSQSASEQTLMTKSADTMTASTEVITKSTETMTTTADMMTKSTETLPGSMDVETKSTDTMTTPTDVMTQSAPPGAMSTSMTSSMTSQQQVNFNKAIAKVSANKDKRINELEKREKELVDEQHKIKDTIEKLLMDKADLDTELRGAVARAEDAQWQTLQEKERLEDEVKEMRKRFGGADGGSEEDNSSPAELVVSTQSDGLTDVTETRDQLKALLHVKEQECNTLKRQLMHMRTSSPAGKMEKVAISDISLGDLVFIYFQETQENYMVYSLEPTLYFLHTESLVALGMKGKGQASSSKLNWSIARITDKEYCQAKKAQNRFKVAVGTKFYRVKAIRYEPKFEHVPRK